MNTLSEIEEYYKAREQQLLKKLHQQEARDAACPVKKFFADTRKAISDWFYQTMPI